jgi:hypothetical protein
MSGIGVGRVRMPRCVNKQPRIQTGDASDRDFHLARVRDRFPRTITPAALRRLAELGGEPTGQDEPGE